MGVDEDLLDGFARDPSDAAFRAIYDRHAPAMYALALRLMGGRVHEAADALQDAWTRAWPRFHAFRRDSSLRTWLCGFIVNCCRERFREPLTVSGVDGMFDELSERPAAPRELAIDLERALASLAAGYRAVIVLHDIEGHTHREIASLLGIDEGTSKSQLSRGRQLLRIRLSGPPASIPVRFPSRGQHD
jgi:RNA polymerase sigma-70 factor (ECF subfamily)